MVMMIGALGTVTEGLLKGFGGLRRKSTSGDHPKYYIFENGLNIEKSPGDLRRFDVAQTLVKDHQR